MSGAGLLREHHFALTGSGWVVHTPRHALTRALRGRVRTADQPVLAPQGDRAP